MSRIISLSNKFSVTETGLTATGIVTFEEWEKAGAEIASAIRSVEKAKTVIRRVFGDWVVLGEANFHELASQCFEADMYAMGTLRNAIYACRNVPQENRVEGLGIDFDIEVARIPHEAQKGMLLECKEKGWTVRQLREKVRDKFPPKKTGNRVTCFEDWWPLNEERAAQLEDEREFAKFCFNAGRSVESGIVNG